MPLAVFLTLRLAPTAGAAFRRTWIICSVFYYCSLFWLNSLYVFNPFAPVGIVLLGIYLGLYPAVAGWAVRRWAWPASRGMQFVVFACAWLIAEWVRTLGRLAMPLSQLGHAWATWPIAIQPAEWLGELGVSLEVLWVGGLMVYWGGRALDRWAGRTLPARRELIAPIAATFAPIAVLAISVAMLSGWDARYAEATKTGDGPQVHVAMLQPNIDQLSKLYAAGSIYDVPDKAQRVEIQNRIAQLQEEMLAQGSEPDWQLAILPETAFTEWDFFQNEGLQARVGAMAQRANIDLLLGAARVVSMNDEGGEFYNSAYLFHADGRRDPLYYDKMRLVPFGEHVPYLNAIPGLEQGVVGILPFSEGKNHAIFRSHGMEFGVLICFESTFSQMARSLVARGAEFLVVITNDAWYGLTSGAARHHDLSLLRAVETRRPIARCANTGISSILTPAGRIKTTLGLDQRGFVVGTIANPAGEWKTWFTRFGNLWLALPALVLAAGPAAGRRARFHS
jgi:apolipoprotein N-acyltransferase